MKRNIIALVFLVAFNGTNLFSQNLYIIPNNQNGINVSVSGNIVLKQFYGPPNYGETPKIDKIESHYVLLLNKPITFKQGNSTKTIEEIQLIIVDKISIELRTDWKYIVNGNAFFAETGHHHTPVIIIVNTITRDIK